MPTIIEIIASAVIINLNEQKLRSKTAIPLITSTFPNVLFLLPITSLREQSELKSAHFHYTQAGIFLLIIHFGLNHQYAAELFALKDLYFGGMGSYRIAYSQREGI